jgi:hypothetical protein
MVALSLYRDQKVNSYSFNCTTAGAILFALSDTSLSLGMFLPNFASLR